MKKYNKSIYNQKYIEESQKISFWERTILLLIPSHRVENEDTISHFKKFNGKFYLTDFKIKDL